MRNNPVSLVLVLLLFAFSLFVVLPIDHPSWIESVLSFGQEPARDLKNFKLGLDLQGGTQVMLEADVSAGQLVDEGAMEIAKTIVENRVNGLGVTEAVVQSQGENRLSVELPGIDNPEQAIETLRSTGQLEFVEPGTAQLQAGMVINTTNHPTLASELQADIAAGNAPAAAIPYPDQVFQTVMTGDVLRNAVAVIGQFNDWYISFELTSDGSDKFYNYTSANIGRPMAIVLDGRVLSAPTIQAAIRDTGQITGQFSEEDANSLAIQMRYGALPIALKVIDTRTIGATLGQESVDSGLRAGILGVVAVLIFMLFLYRFPGLLADLALVIYVLLNLAIFKLIPVTLTLPGIAGFILSVGMAVDANILIFERMKEELRNGRSVRMAVETGFDRAWLAIRDGNLSTLISCAVLYWFGNNFGASVVKGFAITLGIGVLLSMLTAVLMTRTFMRAFLAGGARKLLESRTLLHY
jgi:protein-export membrane protein SecD